MKHFDDTNILNVNELIRQVQEAAQYIRGFCSIPKNTLCLVSGSGLGEFAKRIKVFYAFNAGDIPNYPVPTIEGHPGRLIFGTLSDKPVILVQGRVHFYEGLNVHEVTFYMRLLAELGIKTIILTNAAGGINPYLEVGDLCVINDHINMMSVSDLAFYGNKLRHRRAHYYDRELINIIKQTAIECKVNIKEGTYSSVKGPCYETKAEIRMLEIMGADVVGMSTVPEVIVANSEGIKVAAISLVTNRASGYYATKLSHEEVQLVADEAKEKFSYLLEMIINKQVV